MHLSKDKRPGLCTSLTGTRISFLRRASSGFGSLTCSRARCGAYVCFASIPLVVVVYTCILLYISSLSHDRSTSLPLISGDGYRALADFVCDEDGCPILDVIRAAASSPGVTSVYGHIVPAHLTGWRVAVNRALPSWLRPPQFGRTPPAGALVDGATVFVKADFIGEYLSTAALLYCGSTHAASVTGFRHIVLSHQGDLPFTASAARLLSDAPCVETFFAQNIEHGVVHPRLRALPIGLEDRHRMHGKERGAFAALDPLRSLASQIDRLERLFASVGLDTAALDIASGNPTAQSILPQAELERRAAVAPLAYSAFSLETNARARCPVRALADHLGGVIAVHTHGDEKRICGSSIDSATSRDTPRWGGVSAIDVLEAASRWGVAGGNSATPSHDQQDMGASMAGPSAATFLLPPQLAHVGAFLRTTSEHLFALSPEGNGIQCHRTWESLLSGAIVVVTETGTAIDSLYAGLPVLLLREWHDIGAEGGRDSGAASAATRILLGVAMRVRKALLRSLAVMRLKLQGDHTSLHAPVLVEHESTEAIPICWPPLASDALTASVTEARSHNADVCASGRIVETFPFDPILARVPTADLSPLQLYRTARAVFHLDRMYLPYWLAKFQRHRIILGTTRGRVVQMATL